MRGGGRVPVVLAAALVVTAASGVAVAVTGSGSTAKACEGSDGSLRLTSASGKCRAGEKAIHLGGRGPQGVAGPAGTAKRINFSQSTPEAATVSHYLATSGPVSLLASCQGTAGTTTTLVLSVTGGPAALSYTASEAVSDTTGGVTAPTVVTVVHGTAASLQTKAFDTDTTTGNRSDLVTIVVAGPDGTQVSGTLDAELATAGGSPACTVGGTLAAA